MTKRLHITAEPTHAATPRRMLARRAPAPLVLEPRIMFDAAGVEAAVRHAAEHVAPDAHAEASRSFIPAAVAAPAAPVEGARAEVVFIEDNVNNVAQLVAGVRPGVEVIMLDHTRNGLQQMLDALKGHAPVDAIHLVSHGATGQLSLGTQTLSVDNIDGARVALAQLGESMKPGADLLLYGCDVAQGATGAGFVERMAALTGADVAASTDITGSAAFAGNWTLEAHSGAIETKALELDRAGWSGELVNTVYDANWASLNFNGTGTGYTNIIGDGRSNNNVVRFNSVITIGGQAIDAVVTTTLDRATVSTFDSVNNPSTTGAAYFQPNLNVTAAGGSASFKVDFYLGGTYTGAGTGTAVTLQHVVVNSYDIDGVGSSNSDRQFQVFQGFDRYELASTTQLVTSTLADGSVQFQYTAASGYNNPSSAITADAYRVKVYYDSASSLVVKSGANAAGAGSFNGTAYFALDFSVGPGWTGGTNIVGTPAANLAYSTTSFAEAAANDGTITATSTITLANGAFTGSDGADLAGVNVTNLPAGLTAHVTRTSATTATLSFTGSALAHANANDINNVGVSFGDAAFVSNRASAVTGATRADIVIDFNDTPDTTAPVVTPRSDSYAENRPAGTVVSTVSATDATGVTGFQFAATGTNTSANGYFAIGANGAITLTAAGAAAGSSANDYELAPHTFILGVQARDAAGNWSTAQNVTLTVTNIDEAAPDFSSATSGHAAENQAVLYTATATDNVDFTDHAVTFSLAGSGDAGRLAIDATTGVVRLATGALDFETKTSYTFTVQVRDATGNVRSQQVTIAVDNIDEVAPVFTSAAGATVPENQNVLYQAGATDLVDFTDGRVTYHLQPGGDAGLLAIDAGTGVVTLAQGNLDFESKAAYSFTVQARDASGNARSQVVTVTVADIDEVAPTVTITSDKAALAGGQTATLTFTFSEDVGTSFTASDITLASGSIGTLVQVDATHYTAVYTPDAATQSASVLVRVAAGSVQDGAGNANGAGASLTLAVDTVAPAIAGPAGFTIPENTTAVHQFTAGETVTWSIAGGEDAAHFTLAADGTLAFAGAPDFEHPGDGATSGRNTYIVNVRAVDSAGNASVRAITVTVADVNEQPAGAGTAIQVAEDTPYTGTLPAAHDPDGDPLTYTLATAGAHGQVTVDADGTFHYQGAANYNGADAFSYTVSDGRGGSATYTVAVTVMPVNDAPVGAPATIVATEDTPVSGTLPVALDADGDTVTYAVGTGPAHGTVVVRPDGSYTYTPAADYHGADAFSYTVSDGHGGNNTYTATITVGPVNDAPVAGNVAVATDEDTPLAGSLPAASDADGDHVTYAVGANPQHGSVTVNADGTYVYTPVHDFNGSDSFTYSVNDGHGGSNSYTVAIAVRPVNDAPVASGPAAGSGAVGEPMAPVTVKPFTDIDSPVITYTATRADGTPLPSWLTFDPATLTLAGTPPAGAAGTIVVHVTGSDSALAATTDVTLTIQDAALPTQTVAIGSMTKDTGVSATDFITADGSAGRTVTGTLSAPLGTNEIVRVSFDGGATFTTATVAGTGWSVSDTSVHSAGWTITAQVANSVTGRTGADASQRVVLDIAAPGVAAVTPVVSAGLTPAVTGSATLAPGDTLVVTIDGKPYDVTPHDGTWSVTPTTPLVPGHSYDVTTTVRDSAGNTTVNAHAGAIVITAPVPPQIVQPQVPVVAAPVQAPVADSGAAAPPAVPRPVLSVTGGGVDMAAPGGVASNDASLFGAAGHPAVFALPGATGIAGLRQAAELSDVYTRTEGFRTVVARSDDPALVLFQGVPDQFIDGGHRMALTVPSDAFVHTQPKAVIQLTATLQDGSPLPSWVTFTGQTGQFRGEPPPGLNGELRIKLTARDMDGREATALFRINVGQAKAVPGKSGLSEQLRQRGAVRGVRG